MTIEDHSSPFTEPNESGQDSQSAERFPETNLPQQGTTSLRPDAINAELEAPMGFTAPAMDPERLVIESLNIKIDDVISDRSLIRSEPLTPLPELALISASTTATMNERDGDQLSGWLARVPDEQSDARSFAGGAAMCIGVMLLSTLAGYGTAQLINRSINATENADTVLPTKVAVASSADVIPAWPSTSEFKSAKATPVEPTIAAQIKRVRVEPTVRVEPDVEANLDSSTLANEAAADAPKIEPDTTQVTQAPKATESDDTGEVKTNAALAFAAATKAPAAPKSVEETNTAALSSGVKTSDASDEAWSQIADVENELESLEIAAARAIKAAPPEPDNTPEPDNAFETASIAAEPSTSVGAAATPDPEPSNIASFDVNNFSAPDFDDIAPQPKHVETAAITPDPTPAAASAELATEVAPEKTEAPAVSDPQTKHLFRRAEQFIEEGDIAAARLMLRHLAEAGNGPAAFKLAQAYDPAWLADNGTDTVPPNRDLAVRWYTMAHDRGQDGAAERLKALEAGQ